MNATARKTAATIVAGTASDPVVQKLAQNPQHFREYFALDQEATEALLGLEDLGNVRRKVWDFEQRMKAEYGRKLTGKDCTKAQLIHSAAALLVQQTQAQELSIAPSEAEGVPSVSASV